MWERDLVPLYSLYCLRKNKIEVVLINKLCQSNKQTNALLLIDHMRIESKAAN